MKAIEEMHSRIDTLTSQIERAKTDAEDLRGQAAKLDAQAALWAATKSDYQAILAAYAGSTRIKFTAPATAVLDPARLVGQNFGVRIS
ncbi:hypothetical protein ACFRJ8_14815 [Arthrobacter sp. NPDC056886]|uniref:hypothetical protein n=1 Tax=Arthrobacter sp. NPDC056886 TaxID=3345960 RepID=UPI00366CDEDE